MSQRSDGAQVTLADGTTRDADLVIGADGINSTVAKYVQLSDAADEPMYSGENIFYGVIDDPLSSPASAALYQPHHLAQEYGDGEYIAFPVASPGSPSSPVKVVWAQTYRARAPPHKGEWSVSRSKHELTHYMKQRAEKEGNENSPVFRAAAVTPPERLLHFGLFYRKHKKKWHNGTLSACTHTLTRHGQGADALLVYVCIYLYSACPLYSYILT